MNLQTRINAFTKLGEFLKAILLNNFQILPVNILKQWTQNASELNNLQVQLGDYYESSSNYNPWFTKQFVKFALNDWAEALQKDKLEAWLTPYLINDEIIAKRVGVVMAGNLPMVGFHDYLSVIMSGHQLIAKLSSDDLILIPLLHKIVSVFEPRLTDMAVFTRNQLKDFDAIIATGSNNTARYFEYYFGKYPNIIRKNRNGVAILSGEENEGELDNLAIDILTYFGLGCRSVSKLYIPENYNFKFLFLALEKHKYLANHNKYFNNYEYNKAIYLVNKVMHRDTGFMLFKEDSGLSSPISVVYYETYSNLEILQNSLLNKSQEIQCIIGENQEFVFGSSQHPNLNDYADGVDTIAFLMSL